MTGMMTAPGEATATAPTTTQSWWRSPRLGVLFAGAIVIALGFVIGREDWLTQGAFALTLSVAATGLGIALGLAGEYVLGISFVVAAGAYPTAVLTVAFGWSFWPAAVVGILVATAVGLVLSLPGLRLSQFYFGMLGFFMVFLIPSIVEIFTTWTNGSKGLPVYGAPSLFGLDLDARGMFVLSAIVLTVTLLVAVNLREAPLSMQMRRMRDAPYSLAATGVDVWRVRVATYAITSVLAGAAGAVYSHISIFLQPAQFSFSMTMVILAAVIVGGARTLLGPTIGMIILYIGPRLIFNIEGIGDIVYGSIVLLSVLFFRGGVVQAVRDAGRRLRGVRRRTPGAAPTGTVADPAALVDLLAGFRAGAAAEKLSVRGLRRRFGGVRALDFEDDDEVTVAPSRIVLLLGPNGSGKTTLLNSVSGLVRPDAGSIRYGMRELAGGAPASIARIGIRRSFQTPVLPDELTPVDLIGAAVGQAERMGLGHWLIADPRARRAHRRAREVAVKIAAAAGLGAAADAPAIALASGQRRMVDVLTALVSNSTLMLLDEPAAGLSAPERQLLAAVITGLSARGVGFVVVEHDLELALSLAHGVVVMAEGRPVVQGTPKEIQDSAVARRILLGGDA
ncbi:ATP-binding cassette domain-containing protein [Microbacterium lushaniae]|nr:ATP-binding cassette domain-containing protein [Microbacterium lushaniae]KAA9150595.1 ATP-binding cassette domain-containing protein [Microbacterium lushaniae]